MGMFPARLAPQKTGRQVDANQAAFYKAITHGRTYAPIPQWGPIENAYKTRFGNILDIGRRTGASDSAGRITVASCRRAREADALLAQGRLDGTHRDPGARVYPPRPLGRRPHAPSRR